MTTLNLLVTRDLSDVWQAARQTEDFADYISAREGYRVSRLATFRALLAICPWKMPESDPRVPWRMVRSALADVSSYVP
jgi:hypothetical protein